MSGRIVKGLSDNVSYFVEQMEPTAHPTLTSAIVNLGLAITLGEGVSPSPVFRLRVTESHLRALWRAGR